MYFLYKYLCPDCGGRLEINEDRKVMICQACRKVFEAEALTTDQYLDMADSIRKQGQYSFAHKIYSAVLEKEPDCFRALKGLLLSKNSLQEFTYISGQLTKGNFTVINNDFDYYKDACKEGHKAYFEIAEIILNLGRRYVELVKKSTEKTTEISVIETQILDNLKESKKYYVSGQGGTYGSPRSAYKCMLIFSACYLAVAVEAFTILWFHYGKLTFGSLWAVILALMVIVPTIYLARKNKGLEDALRPNKLLDQSIKAIEEEKSDIEVECKMIQKEIQKLTWELKLATPGEKFEE